MKDESTYGFNKSDAESLLTTIGIREELSPPLPLPTSRGGGSTGAKLVATPGGGIAARSGTTVSSATCTEYKIVGTTLTTNVSTLTVWNLWPVAIPASYYILAVKEQLTGFWIAQFPGVINVRWDSPDLEQTWDGSTYSIIDTATACP